MMPSHLAMPREGHMAEVFRIFAHLRKYYNTEYVFDSSNPVVDELAFEQQDWTSSEFGHVKGKKEIPSNMPESRGIGFDMRAKVDADHAGDTITRQSKTVKQCCEHIRGLLYKLQMMGIPCEGPAYIYGDNKSVLTNTTIPDSTLKKKSH
eukprot:4623845-Ditylum_brightwellii.AAC.1